MFNGRLQQESDTDSDLPVGVYAKQRWDALDSWARVQHDAQPASKPFVMTVSCLSDLDVQNKPEK